jgi:NADH dehydrogenase FAD-containing subunit
VVEIRENDVYIVFDNDLLFLEADTIVLAVGVRPPPVGTRRGKLRGRSKGRSRISTSL